MASGCEATTGQCYLSKQASSFQSSQRTSTDNNRRRKWTQDDGRRGSTWKPAATPVWWLCVSCRPLQPWSCRSVSCRQFVFFLLKPLGGVWVISNQTTWSSDGWMTIKFPLALTLKNGSAPLRKVPQALSPPQQNSLRRRATDHTPPVFLKWAGSVWKLSPWGGVHVRSGWPPLLRREAPCRPQLCGPWDEAALHTSRRQRWRRGSSLVTHGPGTPRLYEMRPQQRRLSRSPKAGGGAPVLPSNVFSLTQCLGSLVYIWRFFYYCKTVSLPRDGQMPVTWSSFPRPPKFCFLLRRVSWMYLTVHCHCEEHTGASTTWQKFFHLVWRSGTMQLSRPEPPE